MATLKQLLVATIIAALVVGTQKAAKATLLVSDAGDNTIKEYDQTTGALIGNFVPAGSGGLSRPEGLAFGPDGNLFVDSFATNSVKEYSGSTGAYLGDFVPSGSNGLSQPVALTFGPDGNLFVGSSSSANLSDSILEYNGQTGALISASPELVTAPMFAGSPPRVTGLAFGQNGLLYVSSSATRVYETALFSGQVLKYDPQTRTSNILASYNNSQILSPQDLVFGPDGNLYASNTIVFSREIGTPVVVKVNTTTGETPTVVPYQVPLDGLNPPANFLLDPVGLSFAPDGNLLLSSRFYYEPSNSIKKFDVNTGAFISDFIPAGSGGLSSPQYLTQSPDLNSVAVPEPTSNLLEPLVGAVLATGLVLKHKQRG